MITSVFEVYVGKMPDPNDELLYWTYMICRCRTGHNVRYHLIRIDNLTEKMERLGCELPLDHCRQIIANHQPDYSKKR